MKSYWCKLAYQLMFRYTARAIFGLLFLCSGCAVQVKEIPVPVKLPEKFSTTGRMPLANHWWLAFNDESLNQLISQALNENFSIQAAYNRLEQARAIAKKTGSELMPAINNNLLGSEKSSNAAVKTSANHLLLGFAASYEIDLWGRIRSATQAAELDVHAAAEEQPVQPFLFQQNWPAPGIN